LSTKADSGNHGNFLNLGGELNRPRKKAALLTVPIVCAVIARALELDELAFAALIALSFHCMLLRTGEALALQFKALELGDEVGVCSLYSSKSGLRTGSEEAVSIRDPLVLDLLPLTLVECQFRGQRLWPHSSQSFRNRLKAYMRFFRISHLNMKPYSLGRGGATWLLQQGVPLDVILVRGRWKSLGVARLYLEDGLGKLRSYG